MSINSEATSIMSAAVALASVLQGSTDPSVLAAARTTALALRSRCATLRLDLDVLDVAGGVDEGADQISAALWERETRHSLVLVSLHSGRAAERLSDLEPGGYRQRVYVVSAGDTLQSIAQREMGTWEAWPQIVAANGLDPGAALTLGTELIIPIAE